MTATAGTCYRNFARTTILCLSRKDAKPQRASLLIIPLFFFFASPRLRENNFLYLCPKRQDAKGSKGTEYPVFFFASPRLRENNFLYLCPNVKTQRVLKNTEYLILSFASPRLRENDFLCLTQRR